MRFPQREEGQGLVEYALLLVLVAIVVIAILVVLGDQVQIVFTRITYYLQGGSITPGLDYDIASASATCQRRQNNTRIIVSFDVHVSKKDSGQPVQDPEKVIALVIASGGDAKFEATTDHHGIAEFNNKAVLVTACSDSARIIAGDDMVNVPVTP